MIVLDASVVLAWCFEDEQSDYADHVAGLLESDGAIAPSILPFELANALGSAERRARLSADAIPQLRYLLGALPIEIEPISIRASLDPILEVARAFRLSAYDAAYLELARRLRLPLATLDDHLRDAAGSADVSLVDRA